MKTGILLLILNILLITKAASGQVNFGFIDGRNIDITCKKAQEIIESKPKEVLLGIHLTPSGDVYFSISSKEWFDKIFSVANCITADIVSKEKYQCVGYTASSGLFRGYVMPPLLKINFKQRMEVQNDKSVLIKLGSLPANLINKEVEGNIVIACDRKLCFYTNFVDIDRSVWQLLPMGLYTDTLIQASNITDTTIQTLFTYARKVQVTVPFLKGTASYNKADFKPIFDSLNLANYSIKKVEILAYSSVEGLQAINENLVHKRAAAMIDALKQYEPGLERIKIITAENWIEFLEGIKNTSFKYLSTLSKQEIKIRLQIDKELATKLENLLALERKAVVTVYLDTKSPARQLPPGTILESFTKAVKERKILQARAIQKEIVERVADNKLPEEYLNKLEVPMEKDYADLISDREIYKYQLKLTSEFEALEVFVRLRQIEPDNGRIVYNICALQLLQCQTGDTIANKKSLLTDINQLAKKGIDASLIKRLLINYHILICADYLEKNLYDAKDSALAFIKNNYATIKLTDEDRLSLAKYFEFYSQDDWAMEIISDRIGQIDVSEDIIFYYLNLLFFQPGMYESEEFEKAVLNAINHNRQRYCNFFNSIDKGGASMQLLEYDALRKTYCDNCQH